MSLSGNLKTMPLADLLQFLNANRNTGTLQIRLQQVLKMIFFEEGTIVSSSSSDPKEYLGHFLLSHGYIAEEELKVAMEIQRTSKMLLGKILVLGGKLKEAEMTRLLKLKSEETVYSLFLWDEGEFIFYNDKFTDRLFVRISLDPQSLIFEGMLRRDEWHRIREVFPHNAFQLEKNNPPVSIEKFDAQTRKILDSVDGQKTIEDIILAVHSVEYVVCKALYLLYEAGLIRIKAELKAEDGEKSKGIFEDLSVTQLMHLGKEKVRQGRLDEALDFLRNISSSAAGYDTEIAPLLQAVETSLIQEIYKKELPPERTLRLQIAPEDFAHAGLTPEEGFLLSRIDGNWDIRAVLTVTPMKEVDALRLMKKLLNRGIISLK